MGLSKAVVKNRVLILMIALILLVLTPVILDRREDRQWNSLQSTI